MQSALSLSSVEAFVPLLSASSRCLLARVRSANGGHADQRRGPFLFLLPLDISRVFSC